MLFLFSAILSTADSCLMAASGNIVTDILAKFSKKELTHKKELQLSQIVTLLIGVLPYYWRPKCKCIGAHALPYAFMVSGLFVPCSWCFILKKSHPIAA
jgi:SSS family solute:Na+ symporter